MPFTREEYALITMMAINKLVKHHGPSMRFPEELMGSSADSFEGLSKYSVLMLRSIIRKCNNKMRE